MAKYMSGTSFRALAQVGRTSVDKTALTEAIKKAQKELNEVLLDIFDDVRDLYEEEIGTVPAGLENVWKQVQRQDRKSVV